MNDTNQAKCGPFWSRPLSALVLGYAAKHPGPTMSALLIYVFYAAYMDAARRFRAFGIRLENYLSFDDLGVFVMSDPWFIIDIVGLIVIGIMFSRLSARLFDHYDSGRGVQPNLFKRLDWNPLLWARFLDGASLFALAAVFFFGSLDLLTGRPFPRDPDREVARHCVYLKRGAGPMTETALYLIGSASRYHFLLDTAADRPVVVRADAIARIALAPSAAPIASCR